LAEECLDARIDAKQVEMRRPNQRRVVDDAGLLQFAHTLADEHERHHVEQHAGRGKERTQRNPHAEFLEGKVDHRQHD